MKNKKIEYGSGFTIQIMGYTDSPGIGYVRFEGPGGEYLGSIGRENKRPLEKLWEALNDMRKQNSRQKRGTP